MPSSAGLIKVVNPYYKACMPIQHRPTQVEIDLAALRFNFAQLRKLIPAGAKLVPIIKANAYGHGAVFCARSLKSPNTAGFGVATVEEGIELRNAGVSGDIFVLGGVLTEMVEELWQYKLKPIIYTFEDLERVADFAKERNQSFSIHLKVDTGMGRLGFFPSQWEELIGKIRRLGQLTIEGVLTHLARADEAAQEPTEAQFELFQKFKTDLEAAGIKVPVYHIANSAAIIDGRVTAESWARPGLALFGAYPNLRQKEKIELKPCLKFTTRIISIKTFPARSPISYGGTFITARESRIAVIPVGYADGYSRSLSNRSFVLVQGKRVPVRGRVCMDLTMIDVTDLPQAVVGEEVVLIGKQGQEQITAEEVAQWSNTISYEVFCGISARVPRIYKDS